MNKMQVFEILTSNPKAPASLLKFLYIVQVLSAISQLDPNKTHLQGRISTITFSQFFIKRHSKENKWILSHPKNNMSYGLLTVH